MNKKIKEFLIELESVFKKHDASIYFSVDRYMDWDMEICVNTPKCQSCLTIDDENGIDPDVILEIFKSSN